MTSELINPNLADLEFLVGDWLMSISNAAWLPEPDAVVTGSAEIRPIEGGSLLAMRQLGDGPGPPLASWVIGRNGSDSDYTVLYADARGVSRVYEMTFEGHTWRIWRDDPEFSQRFEATISADGDSIAAAWQKRSAGAEWEHDFDIVYSRR